MTQGGAKVLFFADGPLCPRLHAFLDGELHPRLADCFRDHLGGCPACAKALEDAMQLELLVDLSVNAQVEREFPPPTCEERPSQASPPSPR
ncbi:MAG TPA: zf-HC2 domain-containing protein [Myxococcaceae bacterium]|nr:zf-HC2 domain-containing protein [Myxococcaceae bacterium]